MFRLMAAGIAARMERRNMARKAGAGVSGRHVHPRLVSSDSAQERRLATPNPDLLLIKIGERREKLTVPSKERASGVLAKLAKAIGKPGFSREGFFQSSSGKPVYAYSVYSTDPSKLVREDASGRQTIGRFVNGRFYPTSSAKAV